MAKLTRKRKAVELESMPERRPSLENASLCPEEYQVDDESQDDYSDVGSEPSEVKSEPADTPNTQFSPAKKFPSQEKTLKCTFAGCTKSFNRPVRLATHLRSHNNERTFVCTYDGCDKSYFDQKHLKQHIKGSHTHERSYECNWEGCTKSFLTNTRLKRHIQTHEGHNRFRCNEFPPCNQTFRKHQTLQRHIRSDHLQLSPFPCTHIDPITSKRCDAGFDGSVALRKHEDRVHSLPGFFCPTCTLPDVNADGSAIHLGFTTVTKLQTHIKKEHANCPFCDRKCSSQRELQKHVEIQHSGSTLEDRKKVPCTFEGCDKTFTKKYNRDVHIRTQHEGSRFICGTFDVSKVSEFAAFNRADACGKDFVSKANLEDHIRTAHLGLPSRINANRKKSAPNSEDELSDDDLDDQPKPKTRKAKGKRAEPSAIDELLGFSYANDSRRDIPCLVTSCPHLFIRDYDLQKHMRTKHRLSTPEIENLANGHEPEFLFPPEDLRNDDAYGEEDINLAFGMQDGEDIQFWFGRNDEERAIDQWTLDEAEMRQLVGDEGMGGAFGISGEDGIYSSATCPRMYI